MSETIVRDLPLADLIPTPLNPRTFRPTGDKFTELCESVRSAGVQVPGHARPHPEKKDKWDLIAGRRRFEASKTVGRDTMPIIVHDAMTDEQAFELTVMENFARRDLDPVDEGNAVALLLEKHNDDVQAVAAQLGHTAKWVRLRQRIHTGLIKPWRKRFVDPESDFSGWTAGHIALIARLPAETQRDLLATLYARNHWQSPAGVSVGRLEEDLAHCQRLLKKAPWKLDDRSLVPRCPSCLACLKRTGRQPTLFDQEETADVDGVKKHDRCLDPACWRRKTDAFAAQQVDKLAKQGHKPVCVYSGPMSGVDMERLKERFGEVSSVYGYTKAKKGAAGAVPTVLVHTDGDQRAGGVRWMKPARSYGASSSPSGRPEPGKPKPLKQRRQELHAKRWAQVIDELREKVEDMEVEAIQAADAPRVVLALAGVFGTASNHGDENKHLHYSQSRSESQWEAFDALLAADDRARAAKVWEGVRPVLCNRLCTSDGVTQTRPEVIQEATRLARLLGVDTDAMFADVCTRNGFTEPKSWARMKADGSPRKATTKGAKASPEPEA